MKNFIINKRNYILNTHYIKEVYLELKDLKSDYPNFDDWFEKVKSDIYFGSKILILRLNEKEEIVAIAILKLTKSEKKICVFKVLEEYRGKGESIKFMEYILTITWDKPLITVSSNRLPEYQKLFDKFGFELFKVYESYYKEGLSEYCFNGFLN